MTPIALTIAGSDPSGGAGIQADLKTFHQRNVYGMSVLTLLTVQNTCSVDAVEPLAPDFVLAQLDSVLAEYPATLALFPSQPGEALRNALAERKIQVVVFEPLARQPDEGDFISVMQDNFGRLMDAATNSAGSD